MHECCEEVQQFEDQQVQRDDDRVILILDVSRAFFHPEIKRTVYCELPEEDKTEGEGQVGGEKVRRSHFFHSESRTSKRRICFPNACARGREDDP